MGIETDKAREKEPAGLDARVLVVGAGPVGLTVGCELARRGVSCLVLEQRSVPTPISRAMGIHRRTLEVLGFMEVIDTLPSSPPDEPPRQGGLFMSGDRVIFRWWSEKPGRRSTKGRWLPQSMLEQMLQDRFERLGGRLELGVAVTAVQQDSNGVVAVAGDREFRGEWLVACDGGRSAIRKSLGLTFGGKTHKHDLLLADVNLEWESGQPPDWARMPDQPLVHWLTPRGLFQVWKMPHRTDWRLMTIIPARPGTTSPVENTQELMQRLLTEGTGDPTLRITGVTWMSSWRLSERMIPAYRRGRVFLAGDAAHIHSPMGGQGLNTGVQDAYNIAWKLAMVAQGTGSPMLLDTYEEERLPIARRVLKWTRVLAKAVGPAHVLVRNQVIVRHWLMVNLLRIRAVRAWLLTSVSQVRVNYRNRSLSTSVGSFGRTAPRAGDRAPNASGFVYPDLSATSLFDEFRHPRWQLMLFEGEGSDRPARDRLFALAAKIEADFGESIKALVILRREGAPVAWEGRTVIDREGDMHSVYGADTACLYLVRPDRYIGLRCRPAEEDSVFAYLGRVFESPVPGRRESTSALVDEKAAG